MSLLRLFISDLRRRVFAIIRRKIDILEIPAKPFLNCGGGSWVTLVVETAAAPRVVDARRPSLVLSELVEHRSVGSTRPERQRSCREQWLVRARSVTASCSRCSTSTAAPSPAWPWDQLVPVVRAPAGE